MRYLYNYCFRSLNTITEAVMERPGKELSPQLLELVNNYVDSIEISMSDLRSAKYDSNPYALEEPLYYGTGMWDYDDDEYYARQLDQALSDFEKYDVEDLIDDENISNKDKPNIIAYLNHMIDWVGK